MKKKVCGVMITYNADSNVIDNVNTYINQLDFLYIIDNGSSEKHINILKKFKNMNNLKIIYNKSNLGIAAALNIGIKEAKKDDFEWVMFLDDDSKATDNMVKNMFDMYEKVNDANIVSLFPTIIEENMYNVYRESLSKYPYKEVLVGNSSGNIVKLNIFDEVGYLREDFFIDSVDNEFCLRIVEKGYKHIQVSNSILIHNLGASKEKRFIWKKIITTNHSAVRRYYIARNRIVLWRLYRTKFPEYVREDRVRFISEILKIVLYEDKKILKLKLSIIGISDGVKNILGKYEDIYNI